jgi:hypothetical protein
MLQGKIQYNYKERYRVVNPAQKPQHLRGIAEYYRNHRTTANIWTKQDRYCVNPFTRESQQAARQAKQAVQRDIQEALTQQK